MLPSRFCKGQLVKLRVTAVKQQSSQTEREPKVIDFTYESTVHTVVVLFHFIKSNNLILVNILFLFALPLGP